MRYSLALVLLVALLGPATAFTPTPTDAHKVPILDRAGLSADEYQLARMQSVAHHNLADTQLSTIIVPAGNTLVGRIVEGRMQLDVTPSTGALGVGIDEFVPTSDCDNDVPGSIYPVTANPTLTLLPNFASLGTCSSSISQLGPVNYFSFHAGGDIGGTLVLAQDSDNEYVIDCNPHAGYAPVAMAGGGIGVQKTFEGLVQAQNADCKISAYGALPSDWSWHYGLLYNWNRGPGDAYASIASSVLHVNGL